VVALVDTRDVERAAELFASGVQEIVVRDASSAVSLRSRIEGLVAPRVPARPVAAADAIAARSPAMRACLELVRKAQRSDATVLLLGETGTGKEVLARSIHAGGRRTRGPFVAINCAAFPETLLESELFGHDRGAFTGASRARAGHFVAANGGTIFLVEIGETSLVSQVKLLLALQEGTVRPLGADRGNPSMRIVAATSATSSARSKPTASARLFFRLNVFPISLPPLRPCRGHRPAGGPVPRAEPSDRAVRGRVGRAPSARDLSWPGNVRGLENWSRASSRAESGARSPRACCRPGCWRRAACRDRHEQDPARRGSAGSRPGT
jgi:transcriptional regulator with GAF, ATPase, and Fis domain